MPRLVIRRSDQVATQILQPELIRLWNILSELLEQLKLVHRSVLLGCHRPTASMQFRSQDLPCSAQPRPDGAGRDPEGLCYPVVAERRPREEQERITISGVECRKSSRKRGSRCSRVETVFDLIVNDIGSQGEPQLPSLGAAVIPDDVRCDPEQPGQHRASIRVEPRSALKRDREGLSRHVFRDFASNAPTAKLKTVLAWRSNT
jgi:hypothetical protein